MLCIFPCVSFTNGVGKGTDHPRHHRERRYVHVLYEACCPLIVRPGLSSVFVVCVCSPSSLGSLSNVVAVVLVYGFYTMSLNIAITGAIVVKILQYRHLLSQALGERRTLGYAGIISILIESASIIVAYDLFFLIPAAIGHPLANIGRQIGTMIQVCTNKISSTPPHCSVPHSFLH